MKLINFQAPDDFIQNLRELAKRQTVSISVVIRLAVLEYMEKHKLPESKKQPVIQRPKKQPAASRTPGEKKYYEFIEVIKEQVSLTSEDLPEFEQFVIDEGLISRFINEEQYNLMHYVRKAWGEIMGVDYNDWEKI